MGPIYEPGGPVRRGDNGAVFWHVKVQAAVKFLARDCYTVVQHKPFSGVWKLFDFANLRA